MQDGKVETRAFAHEGKIRLQVVDVDDAVEMEGGIDMAQHLIESLQIAIEEAKTWKPSN